MACYCSSAWCVCFYWLLCAGFVCCSKLSRFRQLRTCTLLHNCKVAHVEQSQWVAQLNRQHCILLSACLSAGACFGAGVDIITACDIRFSTQAATFCVKASMLAQLFMAHTGLQSSCYSLRISYNWYPVKPSTTYHISADIRVRIHQPAIGLQILLCRKLMLQL